MTAGWQGLSATDACLSCEVRCNAPQAAFSDVGTACSKFFVSLLLARRRRRRNSLGIAHSALLLQFSSDARTVSTPQFHI